MNTLDQHIHAVLDFHKRFKQPWRKMFADASNDDAELRLTLHEEEHDELTAAVDDLNLLDAIVDALYITAGTCVTLGLQPRLTDIEEISTLDHSFIRLQVELKKRPLCPEGLRKWLFTYHMQLLRAGADQGYNVMGAFNAVHNNNMAKGWTKEQATDAAKHGGRVVDHYKEDGEEFFVVHRADGKLMKPPGHPVPNLNDFI